MYHVKNGPEALATFGSAEWFFAKGLVGVHNWSGTTGPAALT